MDWQEKLRIYFEKENYEQCLNLLNEEKAISLCNDEDLSLNLFYTYMYMYMLKRSSNTETQMSFLSEKLLVNNEIIRKKYGNSAKTIFYTAYISSIAEWLFDMDLEDINKMYIRAWTLEPNNKLYRYGYYCYALGDIQKANLVFEEIRNDENCWKEVERMSILGDSFIDGMEFWIKNSNFYNGHELKY